MSDPEARPFQQLARDTFRRLGLQLRQYGGQFNAELEIERSLETAARAERDKKNKWKKRCELLDSALRFYGRAVDQYAKTQKDLRRAAEASASAPVSRYQLTQVWCPRCGQAVDTLHLETSGAGEERIIHDGMQCPGRRALRCSVHAASAGVLGNENVLADGTILCDNCHASYLRWRDEGVAKERARITELVKLLRNSIESGLRRMEAGLFR